MGIAAWKVWSGIAGAGAIAVAATCWYAYRGILASEPFDAARWRTPMAYRGDPVCHRGRMVAGALREVLSPGATRGAVERVLGPADEVEENGARLYHLGRCRGLGTRLDVLYLYFGMGDRLTQATVMTY